MTRGRRLAFSIGFICPSILVSAFGVSLFLFIDSTGAFASYTGVAYLCQSVSFAIGYSVPAVAMVVAIVIFFLGRNRSALLCLCVDVVYSYKVLPPSGSVLGRFVGMLWEGTLLLSC